MEFSTYFFKFERSVFLLTSLGSLASHLNLIHFTPQKQESAKKELAILDAKRSNVINIGLTALPPPRTIKTAIVKMDSAIMNREAIEVGIRGGSVALNGKTEY